MDEIPQHLHHILSELAAEAHERELRPHLEALCEHVEAWQDGDMTGRLLSAHIVSFHEGPGSDLRKRYGEVSAHGYAVARALRNGVLSGDDVPKEVREALRGYIKFYEHHSKT